MKFLFPNFLWALFLLLIPIIIHLFNFRRYTTVYFSNVQFLQAVKKETKSKAQLRNIIILICRIAIIAVLVLAFARPYIPGIEGQNKKGNTTVAVYIDNSFSMQSIGQSGELLETAKVKAIEICNGFGPGTQYQLITNDFAVEHQRLVKKEQILNCISNVNASHVIRSLGEVSTYFEESNKVMDSLDTRYLFLLSDFQKSTAVFPKDYTIKQNAHYFPVTLKPIQQSNLSIDSVWYTTPGHYKGKTEDLMVRIMNHSNTNFKQIPLNLYINDSLKTKRNFSVNANQFTDVKLSYIQQNVGTNIAKLEINDYPITFDNTLFYNYTIKEKVDLLLINASGTYNYPEKLLSNSDGFKVTKCSEKNIPYDRLNQYTLIVLNGLNTFSTGIVQSISQFVDQGGTLVVFPAKNIEIASYNNLSNALNIAKWNNWFEEKGNASMLNYNHRIFSETFRERQDNLLMPSYSGFYSFQINAQTTVSTLFESESNKPLFIEQKSGKGFVFASSLPLNTDCTNLMMHPIFVPMLYNIALQSLQFGRLYETIFSNIFATIADNLEKKEMLEMQHLKTGIISYPNYVAGEGVIRIFPEVDNLSAGTYQIMLNEREQEFVSFNYSRVESDLSMYEDDAIKGIFNDAGIKIADQLASSANITKGVQQLSMGKELNRLFILIALVLLLIEALLLRILK